MEIKHYKRHFYGIFTFIQMECDGKLTSLHHNNAFHFNNCELSSPLGVLPKGWKCPVAVYDVKTSTLRLIKSWNHNWFNYEPDEYYDFTLDELIST